MAVGLGRYMTASHVVHGVGYAVSHEHTQQEMLVLYVSMWDLPC